MKRLFSRYFKITVLISILFLIMLSYVVESRADKDQKMNDYFGVNVIVLDNPGDVDEFAGWVRDYNHWGWFETQNNQYDFKNVLGQYNFDDYYETYKSLGVKVLMTLQTIPRWVSPYPDQDDYDSYAPSSQTEGLKPQDYREAAEFYYQVVARYGSRKHNTEQLLTTDMKSGLELINAIEVMNEADYDNKNFPFEQYAAMLNAVYDGNNGQLGNNYGIKNADPDLPVSITGVANGLDSIKAITEAAGRAPYDIINVHYYSTVMDNRRYVRVGVPPEWSGLEKDLNELVNWRNQEAPGKPIWLTEIGWDTNPVTNDRAVTEQEAADYLIRSFIIAKSTGIDKTFWYFFKDLGSAEGLYSASGLFKSRLHLNPTPPPELVPKLTYWYFGTMKNILGETSYLEKVETNTENIYHYKFLNQDTGEEVSVLWYCPIYKERRRTAPPEKAEYLYELSNPNNQVKIKKPREGIFSGTEVPVEYGSGGNVSLILDSTPIFVIEN